MRLAGENTVGEVQRFVGVEASEVPALAVFAVIGAEINRVIAAVAGAAEALVTDSLGGALVGVVGLGAERVMADGVERSGAEGGEVEGGGFHEDHFATAGRMIHADGYTRRSAK